MNIAIIDDDKNFCEMLEWEVNEFFKKLLTKYTIDIIDHDFMICLKNHMI